MKIQSKELDDEVQIDMLPMIDMVFLLLIFFIVASQIIDDKPRVAVPPAAAAAISTVGEDETRLMISVSKDDEYHVFNTKMDSFDEMAAAITDAMLRDEKEKVRILIRADGDVPYKTIEKINIVCAEAGAYDIIYAASEEKE